jgi:hypothetical protein
VFKRLLGLMLIVLSAGLTSSAATPKVRISAWYWLNSAPRVAWDGDFVTMKNMGFTDVLLGWGVDVAAVGLRITDTKAAIEAAHRAGLGAYLVVWQPTGNSLERHPEFQQVDSAGNLLFSFDVFNPTWRQTQWKQYLQTVAKAYHDEPGMAGYVFDDSFLAGPVGVVDGPNGTGMVSYGKYEQEHFRGVLPRKPTDPKWNEWVKTRETWWEDWAKDTVGAIREIDSDTSHEIYLEDPAGDALSSNLVNTVGVDFPRVARYFDAVGAYSGFSYDSSPDSGKKAAQGTEEIIAKLQKIVGADKSTIYTFWVADPAEELGPLPAKYPTAEQIQQICEAALRAGIRHLDMYGYRIGDYRVKAKDWPVMAPGTGATYPLTGQFPQKFLWDRPQVQGQLAKYLLSLN